MIGLWSPRNYQQGLSYFTGIYIKDDGMDEAWAAQRDLLRAAGVAQEADQGAQVIDVTVQPAL